MMGKCTKVRMQKSEMAHNHKCEKVQMCKCEKVQKHISSFECICICTSAEMGMGGVARRP